MTMMIQQQRRLPHRLVTWGSAAVRLLPSSPSRPDAEFDSPVQPPSGWRDQRRAEQSSGLLTRAARECILIRAKTCAVCEIGVGPDHSEKSLYLAYAYSEKRTDFECPELNEDGSDRVDTDGNAIFEDYLHWFFLDPVSSPGQQAHLAAADWVRICGDCAARHHVPEAYRVVAPSDWPAYRYNQVDLELLLEACQVVLRSPALFTEWREQQVAGASARDLRAFVEGLPSSAKRGPLARFLEARVAMAARAQALPLSSSSAMSDDEDEDEEEAEERVPVSLLVAAVRKRASRILGGGGIGGSDTVALSSYPRAAAVAL